MAIYYFQLDAHGTPGLLGEVLREFGQQVRQITASVGDNMPHDLDEVHGIIVSGGGASVTATSGAVEGFVRAAHVAQIPMLAIGAGARLAARALGGEVSPCSERAVTRVSLNQVGREEPLFAGQPWSSEQPIWNDECVSKLPEGAINFASTGASRIAAWGLGPFVTAIEWHPEWNAAEIAAGTRSATPITQTVLNDIARTGRLFAERVSLVLMPVDRMASGRARDIHH